MTRLAGMDELDLDLVWERLRAGAEQRDLLVFPSALPGAHAIWPDDRPMDEFLDFAVALGVKVIYAHVNRLDQSDVDEFAGDDELLDLLRLARTHLGKVGVLEAWFVSGGVTHKLELSTLWWDELMGEPDEESEYEDEEDEEPQWEESDFPVDDWVRMLAQDTGFQGALRGTPRMKIVRAKLPQLAELVAAQDWRAGGLLRRIVTEASELYDAEYRPDRERAIAKEAEKLLEQGLPKYKVAAKLKLNGNTLNRILGEYGSD